MSWGRVQLGSSVPCGVIGQTCSGARTLVAGTSNMIPLTYLTSERSMKAARGELQISPSLCGLFLREAGSHLIRVCSYQREGISSKECRGRKQAEQVPCGQSGHDWVPLHALGQSLSWGHSEAKGKKSTPPHNGGVVRSHSRTAEWQTLL